MPSVRVASIRISIPGADGGGGAGNVMVAMFEVLVSVVVLVVVVVMGCMVQENVATITRVRPERFFVLIGGAKRLRALLIRTRYFV